MERNTGKTGEDLRVQILQRETGRVILEARDELGWSQKDLAERARMDPSQLSKIESGKRSIFAGEALAKVAGAMSGLLDPPIEVRLAARVNERQAVIRNLDASMLEEILIEYDSPSSTMLTSKVDASLRRLLQQETLSEGESALASANFAVWRNQIVHGVSPVRENTVSTQLDLAVDLIRSQVEALIDSALAKGGSEGLQSLLSLSGLLVTAGSPKADAGTLHGDGEDGRGGSGQDE